MLNQYIRFLLPSLKKMLSSHSNLPTAIQFPITSRCNSKCIMCNIPNVSKTVEVSADKYPDVFNTHFFSNVKSIGLNGGEPFLRKDIVEIVDALSKIPSLKSLNITTNGLNQKAIEEKLPQIYGICKKNSIRFSLTISFDGIGETHNIQRGIKTAFSKTTKTIEAIINRQNLYDHLELACTITKINASNLVEIDEYCKFRNWNIRYRMAISNKRIGSDQLIDQFDINTDLDARQNTIEFFLYKLNISKKINEQFRYFCFISFLNGSKRYLGCKWQHQGITIDEELNYYYCAVESKKIGNLIEDSTANFTSKNSLGYRNSLINSVCDNCIHDYSGIPKASSILTFYKFKFKNKYWKKAYTYLP